MDHIESPRLFDVASNDVTLDPSEQHHIKECPQCATLISVFARQSAQITDPYSTTPLGPPVNRDLFDLPCEHTDIILIDEQTMDMAQRDLIGCEACCDEAEIPFDSVLDRITGLDPGRTDYLLVKVTQCVFCGAEINEKTLVVLEDGCEEEQIRN